MEVARQFMIGLLVSIFFLAALVFLQMETKRIEREAFQRDSVLAKKITALQAQNDSLKIVWWSLTVSDSAQWAQIDTLHAGQDEILRKGKRKYYRAKTWAGIGDALLPGVVRRVKGAIKNER